MKKENKIYLSVGILVLVVISVAVMFSNQEEEERDFYLGLVPTPKGGSSASFDDLTEAYKEVGRIAEVSMVWVEPQGIGQYEKLEKNQVLTALEVYNLKPVVTLNFATIKKVPGEGLKYVIDAPEGVEPSLSDSEFRKLYVEEAEMIARKYGPDYFSLGNEVNDYFVLNPDELDAYLSLVDEAKEAIKEVSPDTEVMVVFSYTHLVDNKQWGLFEKFNDKVDLFGLTTYPWKHFDNPEDIDEGYYSRINRYTDTPIAFTEIGWISTESEEEQARFLIKFLELTGDLDVEMVNWLFLHEPELDGIVGDIGGLATATVSLKNMDGSKKEIYDVWLDLKQIPHSK